MVVGWPCCRLTRCWWPPRTTNRCLCGGCQLRRSCQRSAPFNSLRSLPKIFNRSLRWGMGTCTKCAPRDRRRRRFREFDPCAGATPIMLGTEAIVAVAPIMPSLPAVVGAAPSRVGATATAAATATAVAATAATAAKIPAAAGAGVAATTAAESGAHQKRRMLQRLTPYWTPWGVR